MLSKAERTKEFIIERSALLFNMKGYAGTSLSDIIEATGLTKGAIYGNFENKDEVAMAVFRHNINSVRKKWSEAMQGQTTSTDKLKALTGYYRSNWKKILERGGCPILNAAVEADDNLSFLKKDVQHSIKTWADDLNVIITAGQKNGEFKKNIKAGDYAYNIITILEGGIMLFKIINEKSYLFAALDRIELIIENELKK